MYFGKEAGVERSKFNWLAGLTVPVLSEESITGITLYFLALFAHDDALDENRSNPERQRFVNDRMEIVLKGGKLLEDDPNQVKAIKYVFDTYFPDQKQMNFLIPWVTCSRCNLFVNRQLLRLDS